MKIRDTKGFTLIELLIVVAIIGIIARSRCLACSAPASRERGVGHRLHARRRLRAGRLQRLESGGYATNLTRLSFLCPQQTVPYISPDLNTNGVAKSGYTFTLANGANGVAAPLDCGGTGVPTSTTFYGSATPQAIGTTGNRAFATNTVGTVWQDQDGSAAPAEPFVIAGGR